MSELSSRLRRLLFLVPYVAREKDKGVRLDQLARELKIDRTELLADIDLLTQVGPPAGAPDEYLLVSVEQNRVHVELAQKLTRPLRLTPAEGCSLLLGLRALRRSGIAPYDEALASAEQKILKALGADAHVAEELAEGTVVAGADEQVARHVRALITAARERRAVILEYAAASSGRASRRALEPYGLVHHNGAWYVIGRCRTQKDVRTFRVDRIVGLEPSGPDDRFAPPADFDLEAYRRERLFVPGADAVTVTVRLDALAAARADWPPAGELRRLPDGGAEIAIETEGFEWIVGWTLGFGAHAEIVSPPEARLALRQRVERMLADLA